MKTLILPLALLVAASARADKVDDLVRAAMVKEKAPGVMVVVLRDGKPIKMKGYGFANVEHRVRVTPDTIFQSGSLGKQFTATLAMRLVQEGKLGLEDPISKYFPEGVGKWEGVTVRHLLTHTSGLADMPYESMDLRKDYTEDELVRLMADQPAPEKPGERWRYNNGGYVLLGVLCGRVGGKFYGDLLAEKVFAPAGMKTARIISEADIVPHRAAGYVVVDGKLQNQAWVAPKLNTTGDGSLYLSARDLIAWDDALNGERVLPRAAWARMWTPTPVSMSKAGINGYGFGFGTERSGRIAMVHHSGAWQGFMTWMGHLTNRRLSVIVLANGAPFDSERLGRQVMAQYEPGTLLPK
jgi:CubicO group peptidase (beta-lactamase class C family)